VGAQREARVTARPQIVIVPVDALDADRIAELARLGAFSICFLAGSYARYTALRDRLPAGWKLPSPGQALNEAAERLRDAVINLDAQAQAPNMSPLTWDASLLAERGPLTSTLMLNLARLIVFLEWTARPGRHLVVSEDAAFGQLLLNEARRRGWDAGWLAPGRDIGRFDGIVLREQLGRMIDGLRRRASVVRRFLSRKLQLAWQRRSYHLRVDELRRADILLVVWGRSTTFPQHGPLAEESYFGRLPALLREAGLAVGYLAYPLTYVSRFKEIAANALAAQEPVALIEDFIPWWVIIPAAIHGLAFPREIGRLSVLGIDATVVLRLEARRDRRLAVGAEARLLSYVGRGLARRGIRPQTVLHLYEAQPWEKMLALGLRESVPSARIIGVQHAPFAWTYLSFFPSRRTIAQRALPDLLLTTGEGYAEWLRDAGVPPDRVAVLGAVRFERMADARTTPGPAVLCCTSIELDEALELAAQATAALEGLGIPLLVNFHPVTDAAFRASVRDAVHETAGASEHVTLSPAPMRELLDQAGCVLYMSSAACFEAVANGRTAIYLKREIALDYDKLPGDMAMRCASHGELRAWLSQPDAGKSAGQSRTALEHWLAPVIAAETLRALLVGSGAASTVQGAPARAGGAQTASVEA
jgi:hypothetical protein